MTDRRDRLQTSLGRAELDRVIVRGHDLTRELMGSVTYTEMVSLLLLARLPGVEERRMLDALLVSLIEHGLVKPVVAARFVYSNAPESLQAAVAASLLGAGSRHLGSSEGCARFLQEALAAGSTDLQATAARIVAHHRVGHLRIPGIGHRTHAEGDPRARRLFEIARETGSFGRHSELLMQVARIAGDEGRRNLAVNVTGAIAGIASDLGYRWEIVRGFALIARTLGALAHIQEEIDHPLSDALIEQIRDSVEYGE